MLPIVPRLVRAALVLALTFSASVAFAQRNYSEGGYPDKRSVVAGGTIGFHIANARPSFDIDIISLVARSTVLHKISGVSAPARDCTGMWENGCAWPLTTTFTVPASYTPGYYAARFRTSEEDHFIMFVVKPAVLGSYAPIAIIQPTNSDLAYNRFGGKSVYDTISDDGKRAHIVSFDRPYFDDRGLARYQIWEAKFVNWMNAERRKFEVITDDDMEAGADLSGYKALLVVGHSEYWSLNARRQLEAFSRSGKHIAIFGANTMWWQVRSDLQSRKMTVYKSAQLDPLTGVNNDLVTTTWFDWPVFNPENTILGASFRNAAYVNKLSSFDRVPVKDRIPYTVRKADHWVFTGTGLLNGAEMGRSVGAIEVDGALFNTLPDGEVVTEGSDGTPLSYEVLATLPASDGYATIGIYANAQGGAVFNGAARDWAYGLIDDPVIQRMTANVLDRLQTGAPFTYAPRATPNRAEDLFNSPRTAPEYLPGWRLVRQGLELTGRCAHEGPMGLEMTGNRWTQVIRDLAVGRAGLSRSAVNVWLNADLLTRSATFGTPLVALVDARGGSTYTYLASLDFMIRPEGRAVRATSYDGSTIVTTTSWVVLKPGWQSIQFSWESPGTLDLNVGGRKVSAFHPKAGQAFNALLIEYAGREMTGSVCMDQLQLRDAFAAASAAASTITASRRTVPAGGSSKVTVRLYDDANNPLVNGGDILTLTTTHGTLSPLVDMGDGSFTATLSAGAAGTATIRATVNGRTLTETVTVTVSAGRIPGRRRSSRP